MRPLCVLPFVQNHAGNLGQFPERHLPQDNNNRFAPLNARGTTKSLTKLFARVTDLSLLNPKFQMSSDSILLIR